MDIQLQLEGRHPNHVVWVWKLSKLKICICMITYFVPKIALRLEIISRRFFLWKFFIVRKFIRGRKLASFSAGHRDRIHKGHLGLDLSLALANRTGTLGIIAEQCRIDTILPGKQLPDLIHYADIRCRIGA